MSAKAIRLHEKARAGIVKDAGDDPDVTHGALVVATVPTLNQADGMHPNAAGVVRIVDRLLPLVLKLLGEARPS